MELGRLAQGGGPFLRECDMDLFRAIEKREARARSVIKDVTGE